MQNLELNHLKYFYYTVTEGGVGAAADKLCIQQPVVSKMLKSLEDQLGESLFIKKGRKKVLTDFGQLVFRHSQVIFSEANKINNLSSNVEDITGPLNIGAAEPIAAFIMPKVLKTIMKKYKNIHPNIYSATANVTLDMIKEGKLEAGFLFHVPKLSDELEVIASIPVKHSLVILSKEKSNKEVIQSFIGSREIDDNSNHKFPTVDKLRKKYKDTSIKYSSNHIGLHKELVLQGRGVSILPSFLVTKELKSGKLTTLLKSEKFIFDMKVVMKRSSLQSPILVDMINKIKDLPI